MNYPEQKLQTTIAEWLDWVLVPPWFYTHFPAGGGGEARGRRLKAMGLKAGLPDLWLVSPTARLLTIELKVPKSGRLSDKQIAAHALLRSCGVAVAVARSLDEVREQLIAWHVPLRETKPATEIIRHALVSMAAFAGDPWPASEPLRRRRRRVP